MSTKQEWTAKHSDFVSTLAYAPTYQEKAPRQTPMTACSKARKQASLLRQLAKHIERTAKLETAYQRAQRHADRLAEQLRERHDACKTLRLAILDIEQS